jgi:uncharacterized RDD family membrane protein YckC
MSPPGPIDRVLGAIVPRAVGAVDIDDVIGQVDVDHLVSEVDVDAVVQRVDVDAVVQRVDIQALMRRVDLDALLAEVDLDALLGRVDLEVLLSKIDLDTLIGRLDVEAIVAQVDANALVQKVDVAALIDRVDVDALIQRVDVDALVGRLDLDALLARVDVDALMRRAHIDTIVSNASRGVFARLIDAVRRQLVGVDQLLIALVDRVFRRRREPSSVTDGTVTGHVAGGVSRLAAFLVDAGVITVSWGLSAALVVFMLGLFSGSTVDPADHGLLWFGGYVGFGFLYYWIGLSITGRSIGKGLIGLRVVASDGSPISPLRAAVRTIVYPFSFILGLGLIPIVLGKRRRALHDVAAGDKVLYDWGDRPAELPAPLTDWVRRRAGGDVAVAAGTAPSVTASNGKVTVG